MPDNIVKTESYKQGKKEETFEFCRRLAAVDSGKKPLEAIFSSATGNDGVTVNVDKNMDEKDIYKKHFLILRDSQIRR